MGLLFGAPIWESYLELTRGRHKYLSILVIWLDFDFDCCLAWGADVGSANQLGMKALSAYDDSKQPTYMPPPGYMGHLRNTKENCFGTTAYKRGSHFRAGLKSWQSPDPPSSPEEELKRREADEANEILQLRSTGLREALKKNQSIPMTKTRYNVKAY